MDDLILVVDDAKFARTVANRALQNGGFNHVIEASTAAETLELFRTNKPDLTLLDITLPDNTDLTLLRTLIEENPDAKIIMSSAIGQEAIIMDAIRIGAKDYILKPYDEKLFLEAVTHVLGTQS